MYDESAIDHLDIETRTDSSHTIVTDTGTISVWWTVYVGNQPTYCLGVTSVDVVVRGAAGVLSAKTFPCGAGVGVTPRLLTGSYSVDVSAHSGTQSASVILDGIAVPAGGRTVLAGPANLAF